MPSQPSPRRPGISQRPSFGLRSPQPSPSSSGPQRHQQPKAKRKPRLPAIEGPLHSAEHIEQSYKPTTNADVSEPKHFITNANFNVKLDTKQCSHVSSPQPLHRSTATVTLADGTSLIGIGDHSAAKQAALLAYTSAAYQLIGQGLIFLEPTKTISLSNSKTITVDEAKNFVEFYCHRFKFPSPDVEARSVPGGWESTITIDRRRVGLGSGPNKKAAVAHCYLDTTQYLDKCDPDLWKSFQDKSMRGDLPGYAPPLYFAMSNGVNSEVRNLCVDIQNSSLYRNRPGTENKTAHDPISVEQRRGRGIYPLNPRQMKAKCDLLSKRRHDYLSDSRHEKMRATRAALPVFSLGDQVITSIQNQDVTICMAATGSGKTTQIPQIILDHYIDQGKGAECNILCTQPRRLAALSVADRVAKERGESLGDSVGYSVRFESKMPENHGSITFCTTGVFLKRLQTALSEKRDPGYGTLDHVTHVVVDEVHERDVDTDLLLAVLRRLIKQRKQQGKPLKVVLMSATIDPTLFQSYFADESGTPAPIVDIPGRSFPVTKSFLDDFVPKLLQGPTQWVFKDESVSKYIAKELGVEALPPVYRPHKLPASHDDDLDIPYPLVAATVAHVLQESESGHVLVFLPGWEDITAVQRQLLNNSWGVNFNSKSYSIHLLHSSIPLAEQQVIFEPPAPGVRRIILATNIAETSVTIPDVVYVVDTGKLKEQRYDPERHIMSLVSAWVGSSNLNQRAGRAGRHRPGDYYGLLGKRRADSLHPYQTVEMSRVDLTNVVMHVKALNFPDMTTEEVLANTIEPPSADRVNAAMKDLQMVGALDDSTHLTSLGRVLLQLPIDVQMGRLVLYGSFFRCLEPALTLAAILSNRDPFVSPMHLKLEAGQKKNSWVPEGFRSDALATLRAYTAWEALMKNREYHVANQFCMDNFLAKPTLLMIQKIKTHLLQSLHHAGVLHVSGGGGLVDGAHSIDAVPPELNENAQSEPLLTALIALASQPKFAIRTGDRGFRTQQEKMTFMHPSSINNRKHEQSFGPDGEYRPVNKEIYAYAEKRRNISVATNGSPMTFLITTTRLDPFVYVMFGAHKIQRTDNGLKCDDWVPVTGHLDGLEDLYTLKSLVDSSMLRVYEGIILNKRKQAQPNSQRLFTQRTTDNDSESWEDDEDKDLTFSDTEIKELDLISRDLVSIINDYSRERQFAMSRANSRPATPSGDFMQPGRYRLPSSSHATPYGSRAGTPLSRFRPF